VADLEKGRFREAMDLVDELLDLPPGQREALLERADPDVREQARKLLEADAQEGAVLSRPAGALLPSALHSLERAGAVRRSRKGERVGPFRLVSLVGEGGMGEVWVAERTDADFEQRVAVKLLRSRGHAATLEARFRLERRILARLSHPLIAKLLDGGMTDDGVPWLAMELVEGLPLTEHCASKALDLEERLRLFLEVCDAVQFAHRNLVVHRDLKPGNILVGASGEPKLLDFGIAKLLEDDPDDTPAALTRTGERPMTPDYAAPEQIRGDAVTTATDVWALGVILHELLTGVRPYRRTLDSPGNVERLILEAAPQRPSTSSGDPALRRRLKGDLDAIVLKALRRQPEERYPSAEALAADVRRHLEGLPVLARGDAASYLLRSFVRRYRVAVTVSSLGLFVVLAGLVSTLWQARRAREEARKAEQVEEFVLGLLESFDPTQHVGRQVDEREILERGEERMTRELADRPDVQAKLLRVFAHTWLKLGVYERARPAAERALLLERATFGPRSDEEAQTLVTLAEILGVQRTHFDEAASDYQLACGIFHETRGKDDLTAATACADVGGIRRGQGRFAETIRLSDEHLAVLRRVLGERSPGTLIALYNRALALGEWGRLDEAVDLSRRTIPPLEEVLGRKHPETLQARHNLGRFLLERGQPVEGEAILREVQDDTIEVLGERYGLLALFWKTHARALDALGRSDEALPLYDRSIELWTSMYGKDSDQVASSIEFKAVALWHLGRLAEAEGLARQALDAHLAIAGENHNSARTRAALGAVLIDEGRADEARAQLSQALAVQQKFLLPTHPDIAFTRAQLARL
jgi:eukaryotic-like serine/threonine-protein kinase